MSYRPAQLILLVFTLFWLEGCSGGDVPYEYSLSPKPNYAASTDPRDLEQLNDNIALPEQIGPTTHDVGWTKPGTIRISAKLQQQEDVGKICLNAAQNQGGELYPPIFFAAYGLDRDSNTYRLLGERYTPAPKSAEKPKRVRLCMALKPNQVDAIEVLIRPRGAYAIFNEMELWRATRETTDAGGKDTRVTDPNTHFSQRLEDIWKLEGVVNDIRSEQDGTPNDDSDERFVEEISKGGTITEDFDDIGRQYLAQIRQSRDFGQCLDGISVSEVDPWTINSSHPPDSQTTEPSGLAVVVGQSGHAFRALAVANCSSKSRRITLRPAIPGTLGDKLSIDLFAGKKINTVGNGSVMDVLLPAGALSLQAGESQVIFVRTHATASTSPGRYNAAIVVESEQTSDSLPIEVQVLAADPDRNFRINVWAYRGYPLIKGREQAAIDDLVEHGVNVFTIKSWDLVPNLSSEQKQAISQWIGKIEKTADDPYYLLYMGLREKSIRDRYGIQAGCTGPKFPGIFKSWLNDTLKTFDRLGIDRKRIFVYPVDEPKKLADFQCLTRVATLVKSGNTGVGMYTTLWTEKYDFKKEYLKDLDIIQVVPNNISNATYDYLRKHGVEIWHYQAETSGKSGDPIKTYLSLLLRAWVEGATGAGFWVYTDDKHFKSVWNDFDGTGPDYGVIYDTNKKIISSRRWAAWLEGVGLLGVLEAAKRHGLIDANTVKALAYKTNPLRWSASGYRALLDTLENSLAER